MAPVDTTLFVAIFTAAKYALTRPKVDKNIVIKGVFMAAGIPVGTFVAYVVDKILSNLRFDATKKALSIATVLEYARRTGHVTKGVRLSNNCTTCGMKGHDRQNHPHSLDRFLRVDARLDKAFDEVLTTSKALNEIGF
jgi:hypothetical protein